MRLVSLFVSYMFPQIDNPISEHNVSVSANDDYTLYEALLKSPLMTLIIIDENDLSLS